MENEAIENARAVRKKKKRGSPKDHPRGNEREHGGVGKERAVAKVADYYK